MRGGEYESREKYEQRQRILLEKRVEEINSRIILNTPGHVRTTGPRRQYYAEIKGRLHLTEI